MCSLLSVEIIRSSSAPTFITFVPPSPICQTLPALSTSRVPAIFWRAFRTVSARTFRVPRLRKISTPGLFVQDEWQIVPQLLLSYGLRYEYETILRDPNNFGPRFSLAYSPLESGKLVMRFGGGIFFNRPLLRTIDDFTLGKQQLFFDTNLLRDPSTGKLDDGGTAPSFHCCESSFP